MSAPKQTLLKRLNDCSGFGMPMLQVRNRRAVRNRDAAEVLVRLNQPELIGGSQKPIRDRYVAVALTIEQHTWNIRLNNPGRNEDCSFLGAE